MGAGLSKIFNGCPLKINCATSWIHPETNDQHILFGCDQGLKNILKSNIILIEGLYYLNLKLLHEEEMVRLLQRKVSWMHITENTFLIQNMIIWRDSTKADHRKYMRNPNK